MQHPSPFPRWLIRADPELAAWESNGLFAAFHAHRVRARGRWWPWHRAAEAGSGLAGAIAVAGAIALSAWLLGLCAGPAALLLLAFAWKFAARAMPASDRLPLFVERWFRPRPDPRGIELLRLIPMGPRELGEAALLDRLQRDWPQVLFLYWSFIAFALGIALLSALPFGLGDFTFAATAIAAGLAWAPCGVLAQFSSLARDVPEKLAEVRDATPMGTMASTAARFSSALVYVPSMILVVALEVVFAYVLLRALAQVGVLYAAQSVGFAPSSPEWSGEAAHAVVGLLLLSTTYAIRFSLANTVSDWHAVKAVAAVDATRLMEELMERESES